MSDEPAAPSERLLGRRIAGLSIDWVLSLLISSAFFQQGSFDADAATVVERVLLAGDPLATLGVWAVQHLLLVATLGTTIGHRLLGIRVVRDDGSPFVGVLRAAGRTALIALVIPAVVWDGEGRGMHDRAVGTHVVRAGRST